MGYCDDLIRRFQQEGLWEQFTSEQQHRFQNLTDEQARQIMVMDDQWEMGNEKAIQLFGTMSLVQMITAFNGALVDPTGASKGRLSKSGRLLAEFFLELKQQKVPSDKIDEGLKTLSPLVIAALIAAYQGASE